MNNIFQFKLLNKNKEINIFNNINLDVSLSFNNLTYTLHHENNNNIINNSILFNLEDTETLYNIFKDNSYQYSYQLNNILFIDNEKNMHILNYNLSSTDNFIIKNNNIELNIIDNEINKNIYSYNYNTFSYIYSNDKNLNKLSKLTTGLYKFNNDFKLNNDKVSLNIDKYKYNDSDINNLIYNYSYILNNYNNNIKLFPHTNKYKKIYYYNNLNLISNTDDIYKKYPIYYCDSNINQILDINIYNDILDNSLFNINKYLYKIPILKENHFIIDIPIIYEYETFVDENFNFMNELYNININNFKIKTNSISKEFININKYIKLNKSKSYIYNYKPIDIDINNSNNLYNFNKVRILLRACLYFDVNTDIYNLMYKYIYSYNENKYNDYTSYQNNMISNLLNINIKYENIINYNIFTIIDGSGNMFKKLYHNYNYGFNFEGYGECIGLLLFPYKNSNFKNNRVNKLLSPRINCKNSTENNNSNNIECHINKKDIFINFNEETLNNILIKNKIPNNLNTYNNIPNFYNVINHTVSLSNSLSSNSLSINDYVLSNINDIINSKFIYKTNKLKCGNINYLYYPNHNNQYYDEVNNINGINLDRYLFYDTYGKYDNENSYVFYENEIIWKYNQSNSKYYPNNDNNDNYILMNKYNHPENNNYTNNIHIITDNVTFTNSKNNIYGKLQIVNMHYNNAVNNYYFMEHDLHNNIFNNVYNYKKSGLQFGDFYTPSIQNYLMLYKFNIIDLLNEDLYNDYISNNYNLSSCQFYRENNLNKFNQYYLDSNFNLNYTSDNSKELYIWPFFSIPDYSIINSDNYFVIFDNIDNCDYIDYYIQNDTKYFNINIKNYQHNIIDYLNIMSDNKYFIIDDDYKYIDNINNIISLTININNKNLLNKNNTFTLYYKDSEDYLNNYKINDEYYRILCKISLKIEDN